MTNTTNNNTANGYNSDNFDLNDWDITIPVNPSGGVTGLAQTILSLDNYASPFFYANADGSMTFMSPVVGATTENTYGARSELRELNPDGSLAAWTMAQGGTMTATLAVNDLPTLLNGQQGKIMVGQIHGNSGELCRLYDDAGKIYFISNNETSISSSNTFQLTDAAGNNPTVALNQQWSYAITAQGDKLTVSVNIAGDVYSSTITVASSWQSETLYFKAGVYDGDAGTSGTDLKQATGYGQATFYGLDMSHTAGQGLGGLIQNAPIANADVFGGKENQAITGNVMSNDTGPAGDALSVVAQTMTTAHGGTVVQNADGSFIYTPAAGYTGTDSFTYKLADGTGLSSTGTVTLTVTAPLQPPIAQADAFSGQENKTVTGNVIKNDTDPNGLSLSVVAATVTTAHGGTVVENADGTFTYTPAAGYIGTDSFNYTLQDNAGLTSVGAATVTLTAPANTGGNGITSAGSSSIPQAVLNELGGVAPTVTMNSSASSAILNGSNTNTANVIVSTGKNDILEGHDGNDILIGGNSGGNKLYGYYGNDLICSGEGNNTLNGGPGNDTMISGSGSNNLTGGGGNDVIVFSEAKVANAYDVITDFSTGTNKIDISALIGSVGSAKLAAATGGTGLYIDTAGTGHFTLYAIFEGSSNVTASTNLNSILTTPLQVAYLAPVAQADIFTGQENQPVTGNVMTNDTDPNGLSLNVVASTVTTAHGGTVVENTDGSFTYTAANGYTGTDSFNYTLTDSAGMSSTGTATVTVSAPTTTPTLLDAVMQEIHSAVPTMTSTASSVILNGAQSTLANIISGSGLNNTLEGHNGNDVLIGGNGGDKLYGYYGNDLIYSGEGNNILNGGPGNDTLVSGSGSNNLTGGGGNDLFVFSEAKALNAHDIITDFTVGSNKLDIAALLGQNGTAQLETVGGITGLYVDPTGTGQHYSLLVQFEGTSNVTLHTALTDILTS